MPFEVWQASTESSGDISSASVNCCRRVAHKRHRIRKAKVRVHNIAQTGTLEIQLKKVDPGEAGGSNVGTKLDNDDLDVASTTEEYEFALKDQDKVMAPKGREYFINISTTNSADRIDTPILILEVET